MNFRSQVAAIRTFSVPETSSNLSHGAPEIAININSVHEIAE